MSDTISENSSRLLILSGPAGAGKTTIVKRLMAESPVPLEMAVSATTRPARPGEVHGREYYFLSLEEFQEREANGEFLECAEVHRTGNWYGTLKSEVQRIQSSGKWVLLEIDVQGAQHVIAIYPEAMSIFLQTPSIEEYERRLRSRGTESEEVILRRLRTAQDELQYVASYQHTVINDDLDRAVRQICALLAEREAKWNAGRT
ncbi:MAG: guanylate kinase [Planctomycetaceae bacterium]|nr:guanylate kinase [Planctomycetaceae bacterium]